MARTLKRRGVDEDRLDELRDDPKHRYDHMVDRFDLD